PSQGAAHFLGLRPEDPIQRLLRQRKLPQGLQALALGFGLGAGGLCRRQACGRRTLLRTALDLQSSGAGLGFGLPRGATLRLLLGLLYRVGVGPAPQPQPLVGGSSSLSGPDGAALGEDAGLAVDRAAEEKPVG